MDFSFSDEQRELGAVVRAFLADHWPEAEVRRLAADRAGWDAATWARCATGIGVPGLAVPERYGGAGYGPLELGVVAAELGAALAGSPFLSSVALATTALLASGDEAACAEHLPALVTGQRAATLAVLEQAGSWDPADVRTAARPEGAGWTLTGVKDQVIDGCRADLLLVAALGPDGPGLYAVDPGAAGERLERTPLDALDPTRPLARVQLRAAPARRIGVDGGGSVAIRRAVRTGMVLLAAEQAGGAARVLDLTVEYAKLRHQFDRPIGSFQAVKHKCADMLLRVEASRSASAYALWAAAARPESVDEAAAIALSYSSEAYVFCAEQCVQIHGGIGFTWEHPAHLYLRRARSGAALFGTPRRHRAELAQLLGI